MTSTSNTESRLRAAEVFLARDIVKLSLSGLILVSVLPVPEVDRLSPLFFAIFATEFFFRLAIYRRKLRREPWKWSEPALLLGDLLATLSFLIPLAPGASLLRFFRLSRMLLLLGYWGGLARDLWFVLTRRERKYQFVFLAVTVVVLTTTSSLIVSTLIPADQSFDFDATGTLDSGDARFRNILFWSYRQIHDPGNLVQNLRHPTVVAVSLFLSISGLFLISFLIGMGTGSVEDLVKLARMRPVTLHEHTVVVGLGPGTGVLLTNLLDIYAKNRKRARIAVLGELAQPDFLAIHSLKSIPYRVGKGALVRDLRKVTARRAKRAVFLTPSNRFGRIAPDADANVVSSILAFRDENTSARVFAELRDERNLTAARLAGGPMTHVLATGRFTGYMLTQVIAFPGILPAYRELLTSENQEIYSYLFSLEERLALEPLGDELDLSAVFAWIYNRFHVLCIGIFTSSAPTEQKIDRDSLECRLNPCADLSRGGSLLRRAELRGVVAIAPHWNEVAAAARSLNMAALNRSGNRELPAAPALLWEPRQARIGRIAIVGGNETLPVLMAELACIYSGLYVRVLLADHKEIATIKRRLHSLLGPDSGGGYLSRLSLRESDRDPNTVEIGKPPNIYRLSCTEHRDLSDIWNEASDELLSQDVFVFLASEGEGMDPDAQTSLGILRLADIYRRRDLFKKLPLRIVAEVEDPRKGDLVRKRLIDSFSAQRLLRDCPAPSSPRPIYAYDSEEAEEFVTVVPSEVLRNQFVVQNLFVHGLNRVYEALSGGSIQDFCRLKLAAPLVGKQSFRDLLFRYFSSHHAILIGVELKKGRGNAIYLNPGSLREDFCFPGEDLVAVFMLGEVASLGLLPHTGHPNSAPLVSL